MKTIKGKIFRNKNKELYDVKYLPSDGYYALVRQEQSLGSSQVIVTSGIMLELTELLLLRHSFDIISIEFMIENSDIDDEIKSLIKALKDNKAYWSILKDKLAFLQREDSIEIKHICYKSSISGEMHDVFVNGIFISPETSYDSFSVILRHCIARCLR